MLKEMDPLMAKYDEKGNLISTPDALKKLYIEHYVKRLKHRQIEQDFLDNYHKKVKLWQLRFERLKLTKSDNWSAKDLMHTLKYLKSNKTRSMSWLNLL